MSSNKLKVLSGLVLAALVVVLSQVPSASAQSADKKRVARRLAADACAAPPSGLVAWYRAENDALDSQGTNHGELQNGATFAAGKVGQAFGFDGVNDVVRVPDNSTLNPPGSLTIEAWVNPNSNITISTAIISKWNDLGGNTNTAYALTLEGGNVVRFAVAGSNGGFTDVQPSAAIPLNTWTHVAGIFDAQAQTLCVFVNGVKTCFPSTINFNSLRVSTAPLLIGAGDFGGGARRFMNGQLDEASIYNRALSDAEILAVFNASGEGKCPPGVVGAGDVIISEFRRDGPGAGAAQQAGNEFVELYNATDAPVTVSASDGSGGWAVAADDATGTRFVVPAGTVIPARGHFLVANSTGYGLSNYPAGVGTTATPDGTYTTDIPPDAGIALFSTANPANFGEATRLDAVGFAGSDALFSEGAGLPGVVSVGAEHSFLRRLTSGRPQDTGANDQDFQIVSTDGNASIPSAVLGAPGPENLTSPVQRNGIIKASLLDGTQSAFAAPNRVRSGVIDAAEPANSARGTLKLRRRFTNTTGQPVTRLRFRVVDITTAPRANASTADLRVLPASGGSVTLGNGTVVALTGLTREDPPVQSAGGGGLNTTLSAALASSVAAGASVDVEFNLGVMEDGGFRFLVNVEALADTAAGVAAGATKGNATGKASKFAAQATRAMSR